MVGFVFVSLVSLVSMSQGNFSASEKKTACPVSMVEKKKKVKNGWFRVCPTCLRCCLDCLNSRFHAARQPKWPVSCLSQLHQLSQHKVSCSKTIKKMDVLWSQSIPIVSIAGFMQKKSVSLVSLVSVRLLWLREKKKCCLLPDMRKKWPVCACRNVSAQLLQSTIQSAFEPLIRRSVSRIQSTMEHKLSR